MKFIILVSLLLTLKFTYAEKVAQEILVDKIIASVNSDVILESDLTEFKQNYKNYYVPIDVIESIQTLLNDRVIVLNILIDNSLLEQSIDELGLKVSDIMLEKRIKEILQQNQIDKNQLKTMISSQGQTFDDWKKKYKKEMERYMLINQEIKPRVAINDYDLKNYYQQKISTLPQTEEFDLIDFVSKQDSSTLTKIKDEISKNGFNETARALCKGGCSELELGFMKEDALIPQMAKEVKSLNNNKKVSKIIKINGVYHLLYLKSSQKSGAPSFESVKDKLSEQYYQVALEREIRNWLDDKKKNSFIEIKK